VKQKFAFVALIALVLAAHAETPDDFAYRAALQATPGLNVINLTEPVFRAAQTSDLRDLRVFNAKGESMPLARLPAARIEPGPAHDLKMVPLPAQAQARDKALADFKLRIERDGERSVIEVTPAPGRTTPSESASPLEQIGGYLIDLRQLRDLDGMMVLHFSADAPDFTGRIEILGSDDLYAWRPIVSGPLVRNRQLGDTIEHNRFVIHRAPPFVRIGWNGAAAPRIETAELVENGKAAPPPSIELTVTRAESGNSWFVDVPPALPIAVVRIRPALDNVSVRVRVFRHDEVGVPRTVRRGLLARRAPEHWVAEHDLDVFRLKRGEQWVESSWFTLSGPTTQLRIDAPASSGLGETLPIVEALWLPRRYLVAINEPGPYVLAVGNDTSDLKPAPALDVRSVLPQDDAAASHLPVALLEEKPFAANAAASETQRIAREASWSRYLLWGALLAAVAALAFMAMRIATQLKRTRAESAEAGSDQQAPG